MSIRVTELFVHFDIVGRKPSAMQADGYFTVLVKVPMWEIVISTTSPFSEISAD